ncbi:AFL201Wp [Eremothecium gossypii ATCC 10895]|uniref:AFL201Wp n=1 Tax=Eremothecium gossypii (strain ATCC 10895 / CBS 109.51 / FGSC 9923 / NRRL Y-1056) TaxID=284811 RepID=Q755L5_EREGS|nr:AFL201Wp [Eremothecium gossypii ATCC 10895]AAS53173.1 AFL201Wp [Eremothecium gossypii ATCC 10895]AEY97483.1 FAFL201Wp [Eremothecium gossypii FDAG1]
MSELFEEINVPETGFTYLQPLGLFIDNEFVAPMGGSQLQTTNPANGELIATFYAAGAADVDAAVAAARRAYEERWRHTSAQERGALLARLAELVDEEREVLAGIETLDSGKPYHTNALADLDQVAYVTRYYAGGADKMHQGDAFALSHTKQAYTLEVPYGVVAQIVPWNYPLAMASWKAQGCLAAGNCVVIKPSENTSLSLLYFASLVRRAGFPPGVFNVLPGLGPEVGQRLAEHKGVDKIAFTGSTAVGQKVMAAAAMSNLKDVTLECGGKSPAVIFADADLDSAVNYVAAGIFYNSGQNCTANSRIYVQEAVYDAFLDKFRAHVRSTYSFGSGLFSKDCNMGPVISKTQYDRVMGYINHGINEKLAYEQFGSVPEKGYYIPPTIFLDVPQSSRLCREEIFGPVAVVAKFKDYDEAIRYANDTNYGLASCVFTENIRVAHRFVRDVQSGTVWVNSSNDEEVGVPFGGFKMSGIGRELGKAGLQTYLQTKAVHLNFA